MSRKDRREIGTTTHSQLSQVCQMSHDIDRIGLLEVGESSREREKDVTLTQPTKEKDREKEICGEIEKSASFGENSKT